MQTWTGDKPTECNLCKQPIEHAFVDGQVHGHGWGIMCLICALMHGTGLGTGKGQLYVEGTHGLFVKVKG